MNIVAVLSYRHRRVCHRRSKVSLACEMGQFGIHQHTRRKDYQSVVISKASICWRSNSDLPQVARVTASLSPANTSLSTSPNHRTIITTLTKAVYERIVHKPDVKARIDSVAYKQCGHLDSSSCPNQSDHDHDHNTTNKSNRVRRQMYSQVALSIHGHWSH